MAKEFQLYGVLINLNQNSDKGSKCRKFGKSAIRSVNFGKAYRSHQLTAQTLEQNVYPFQNGTRFLLAMRSLSPCVQVK